MEIIRLENGVGQGELSEMKRRISSRRYVQCCVVQYFHPRAMKWIFFLSRICERRTQHTTMTLCPCTHFFLRPGANLWVAKKSRYSTWLNLIFLFSSAISSMAFLVLLLFFAYISCINRQQPVWRNRERWGECYEENNESNKMSQIRFQRNFFLFSKIRSANFACLFWCWLRKFIDDDNLFLFTISQQNIFIRILNYSFLWFLSISSVNWKYVSIINISNTVDHQKMCN